MGLNYRKSFKVGNNTRVNLSKNGGIGVSTGVKGARVSVNKKGTRTTLNSGGLQYREDHSFKNNEINNQPQEDVGVFMAFIMLIKSLIGVVFWGGMLLGIGWLAWAIFTS
ncbi:DUF4236 domain-containing protein [Clostridium botulinum]|uniref:DUF4236 domain-containing protein n=1 Tax=Clostridium botulinum TaxID=1491 RepID=UPI001E438381|nr:DUF4236 domain-containing protein [Clostridium botulinum]MCD3254369.1 DUF4236 domain-containing protein [Clostridium botulinum C/D]MCD3279869.1 DUF4236 domain-containing protein [Clostridium botulinum C/D]MCD3339600.1 DUF4236 domain-containing protein [Clostridium botulinum C/D]MCD3357508.1 DUF4236 domain-containing protein [Clostridium botulinum C/D]